MERSNKIVSMQDIREVVQAHQDKNLRVVQCSGVFNITHYEHLEYFDFARQHGDILIVSVNSDAALRKLRGENYHWIPQEKRCEMLAALDIIDHIVVFDDTTAVPIIKAVRPDAFVKGADYRDKLPPDEVQALSECGCELIFKETRSVSATQLVRAEGLLLRNYVERFSALKIMVIGDLALDVYSYGTVTRMSREAPVPVLTRDTPLSEDAVLGQSGNCALNVHALGAKVIPVGVVGCDNTGTLIKSLLVECKMPINCVQGVAGFTTPRKERVFAHNTNAPNQQVARIDDDQGAVELTPEQKQSLIQKIKDMLPQCNGVIFSDYGYGVCTPDIVQAIIEGCQEKSIPVVADSRYRIGLYHGIMAVMPSEAEVAPFLNQEITDGNIGEVVASLRQELGVEYAVVTRGSKGMALADNEQIVAFPGKKDVVDATGAGDTALALFTLALLSGASAQEAAKLSTSGVAITLMQKGTCVITRDELAARLQVGVI